MRLYYDFSTCNKSFIDMHNFLKYNGINNNSFMLILNNPELVNVDPWAPKLSINIKEKVIEECKTNIWYYLREVIRFKDCGGGIIPFKLDKANMALVHLLLRENSTVIEKSRQLRKGTDSIAVASWFNTFQNESIDIISYSSDNRNIYDLIELPDYIKNIKPSGLGVNIWSRGLVEKLQDEIIKKLHGDILIIDDFEYIKSIGILLQKIGISDFYKDKKRKCILQSVVNDENYGQMSIYENCKDFKLSMYDRSVKGFVHIKYPFYELLEDPEVYFTDMIRSLNRQWDVIRREVLLDRK